MQARVVRRRPARAGHGVFERDVEPSRLGHGHAHGDGLVAFAAGSAQLVEPLLKRRLFRLQLLALVVKRLQLGSDPAEGFLGIAVELLPFVERRPCSAVQQSAAAAGGVITEWMDHVAGRNGAGRSRDHAFHKIALLAQNDAAVVKGALLLLQPADLILELLHARVGREVDIGGLGVDVEDGGGGGAAAGSLQRLVEQRGRQAFEDDRMLPGGQLDRGRARDHRPVQIDWGGGEARLDRSRAKKDGRSKQDERKQTQGFHNGNG